MKGRIPVTLIVLLAALTAAAPAAADEPRIVGGTETTIDEWPWQVAIAVNPDEAPGQDGLERQFCGGSLVAPTVVVTAGHCAYDLPFFPGDDADEDFDDARHFSVIAGQTQLSTAPPSADVDVLDYYYFVDSGGTPTPEAQSAPSGSPPLFDPSTLVWDAVVFKLASPAPAPAAPIAIAGAGETDLWEPGDPAWITGWGTTSSGGSQSDVLREADVEIVGDTECGTAYAAFEFDPETMVCAGIFPEGGKDTCQGDSGGPLVVPAPSGGFRLVGDTSWGLGCAAPGFPGVYGRIAADPMRSAIEQAIALASPPTPGGPPPDGDTKAPATEITKGPKAKQRKRGFGFEFHADEAGSIFECSLDQAPFQTCGSPFEGRVRRGRHNFRVRAIDAAGNVGSAAERGWKVKRRRR